MSDANFPSDLDLLDDVVHFSLASINEYFKMSGNAAAWEIPERWVQSEIARNLRNKYGIYIWLELPIARILEWMSPDPNNSLVLEGERTGGRLDIGLFPATQRPSEATFKGAIELKRYITNGSECVWDAERIRAMRQHFPLCGIVGGMLIAGDPVLRRERFIQSLGVPAEQVRFEENPSLHTDGYHYGYIAALV